MSRLDQRLHVRLAAGLREQVRDFADKQWMSETDAIRYLVTRGLGRHTSETSEQADSPAAVAALVASEQILLLLQTIVPEGPHRAIQLGPEAVHQAERRLGLVSGDDESAPAQAGPEAA